MFPPCPNLQHFVEVAPDSNPMKADAKAILTELKNTENVTPEKTSRPTNRRRPRPGDVGRLYGSAVDA